MKDEIILICIVYGFVHNMLSKHSVFSLGSKHAVFSLGSFVEKNKFDIEISAFLGNIS